MLDTIIVDLKKPDPEKPWYEIDPREQKLFPFVYLIAEHVVEADEHLGPHNDPDRPFVHRVELVETGRPNFLDIAQNDHAPFFSASKHNKRMVLAATGLQVENAILVLAAAGLNLQIPNLTLNLARSSEIQEVRARLVEERADYRRAMAKMADEAYDRLVDEIYGDTIDWALNEAQVKLRPKIEEFEKAMRKLDRALLERIGLSFFKEGIPAIGSSLVTEGLLGAGKKFVEVMLQVLCTNLAKHVEERQVPDVVYGFKLKREIAALG